MNPHLQIPWHGISNLAYIGERKKLCPSFGKVVDLLLAVCMLVKEVADILFHFLCMLFQEVADMLFHFVCMLVQEVADMLFHLGLTFRSPCSENLLVMGPLVLLIS